MTCDCSRVLSQARFSKAWKQGQEEVQKSSFLSDQLNHTMLKVIMEFLPNEAKKLQLTLALRVTYTLTVSPTQPTC